MRTAGKLAILIAVMILIFWHWVGRNAEAKCMAVCCLIIPTTASVVCCVTIGGSMRMASKTKHGIVGKWGRLSARDDGEDRMSIPVLGGVVLGTILACLSTPVTCGFMCRIFQADMCIFRSQPVLPSLVFGTLSSSVAYILTFGSLPEAHRQA